MSERTLISYDAPIKSVCSCSRLPSFLSKCPRRTESEESTDETSSAFNCASSALEMWTRYPYSSAKCTLTLQHYSSLFPKCQVGFQETLQWSLLQPDIIIEFFTCIYQPFLEDLLKETSFLQATINLTEFLHCQFL